MDLAVNVVKAFLVNWQSFDTVDKVQFSADADAGGFQNPYSQNPYNHTS